MAVWMPIANANRPSIITNAKAGMMCPRAKNITAGSRIPVALPAAKPVGGGAGLSGGAIAGIVVDVVVGLAFIGGLAARWLQRRRKASKTKVTVEKNVEILNAVPSDCGHVQSTDTEGFELPPDWRRPELDAGKDTASYELPIQNMEKELLSDGKNGGSAVELEGTIPGWKVAE